MSVAFKLSELLDDSPHECEILDVAFLNRNTFGDKMLRNEIVGLFLAQLDGVSKNLTTPLDATAWQFLTHTLKGAAAAVGARRIAALADVWSRMAVPQSQTLRAAYGQQLSSFAAEFKSVANQL
jgi:Hpt domain